VNYVRSYVVSDEFVIDDEVECCDVFDVTVSFPFEYRLV